MEILVSQEMRFLEEALITLRAIVASVLNVVSLLMIHQIHFLEKLLLTDFTAKLRLLQMHFAMSE